MTETAAMIAVSGFNDQKLKALDHVQVKCDSDQHLCIQTPSLFQFYIQKDASGFQISRPVKDSQGFWPTQDLAEISGEGEIYIKGRSSNQIKISGELVSVQSLQTLWEKQNSMKE